MKWKWQKIWKRVENMGDIICQLHTYTQTYNTAFWPIGWDDSVGHLDGYDAS